jgi:hypothetical protein
MRHWNQPQPPVRSGETAQPTVRVLIAIPEAHREVQCLNPVVEATATNLAQPLHPLPFANADSTQIGVGSAQSAAVSNGDRQHPGHLAGKGHLTTISSAYRRVGLGAEVQPPVPTKLANGCEIADYLTTYRARQTRAVTYRNEEEEKRCDGNSQRNSGRPFRHTPQGQTR